MSVENSLGQPVGVAVDPFDLPLPGDLELGGVYCALQRVDPARDGGHLYEQFAHASETAWTYLPYGPFDSRSEFDAWLVPQVAGEDPAFFAISDVETGEALGVASYLRVNPVYGSIEVGHIHFGPQMQRTRIATEAIYLMMRWAFETGYRRFEWKCDALNAPSRAAALRFGFQFEGVFRQHLTYKGRNRDTAWFSIIDSEWPAIEANFKRWLDVSNFDADGQQLSSLQTT